MRIVQYAPAFHLSQTVVESLTAAVTCATMSPQRRYTRVAFDECDMLVGFKCLNCTTFHCLSQGRIRLGQTRGDALWGEDPPDVPGHHATKAHTSFATLNILMRHLSNPKTLRSCAASALVLRPIADSLAGKDTKSCCAWLSSSASLRRSLHYRMSRSCSEHLRSGSIRQPDWRLFLRGPQDRIELLHVSVARSQSHEAQSSIATMELTADVTLQAAGRLIS
jgi:hypothetical protein